MESNPFDLESLKAKLTEHGKRVYEAVKTATEKAQAKLTSKQETELVKLLESIPPTCTITKLSKKGFIQKKLVLTIECRDPEDYEVEVED